MTSPLERCKQLVIALCEYARLTFEVRHLVGHKIKVLVVPADGTPLVVKSLHTVETDIAAFTAPPTMPIDLYNHMVIGARHAHMIYHYEERACQPDIKFLPDIKRLGSWDDEAWNHRRVAGTANFHLFFTRSKSGLEKNPHVGNRELGDMFILKVSDTTDLHGKHFYVDIVKDELFREATVDLLWHLPLPKQEVVPPLSGVE